MWLLQRYGRAEISLINVDLSDMKYIETICSVSNLVIEGCPTQN